MAEVIVNGYKVDTDTGEIVGLADEPERFKVHDLPSAEWVLDKFQQAESEKWRISALRKARMAQLDAMEKDAERRLEWLNYRFKAELEEWFNTQDKKGKSIKLSCGTIGTRSSKPKLVIKEERLLQEYLAMAHPEILKFSTRIDLEALKELVRKEPFHPDVVKLEEGHEEFYVRTSKEGSDKEDL